MTPCIHLKQLYQLCQDSQLRLSSSDLIHVICKQCQKEEVCPSVLMDEYEANHPEANDSPAGASPPVTRNESPATRHS
jgi:hypothetical protein